MKVVKKDGTLERFDFNKILTAVQKSADRIGVEFDDDKKTRLEHVVMETLGRQDREVSVERIHSVVEMSIHKVDVQISNSYSGFRNWKNEMTELMETITVGVNKSMNERDRSNSNLNSVLFSSRRTNVSKILLKEMYMKYFLLSHERQAVNEGFIYPHDMDNRLIGTHNCSVINVQDIMGGGFNINGYFCKEPKNIVNAVGVMGDILITVASAQYGGLSLREVDTSLAPYCKKTYENWLDVFCDSGLTDREAHSKAMLHTKRELKDALQGLEFQLNTRESSRGDYAFTTFSFGKDTDPWAKLVAKTLMEVRVEGHGKGVKQKMIFPKLVFILRDDNKNDDLFDFAIDTSIVSLYPDYIGEKTPTPMGCRSFLNDCVLGDGYNLNHSRGNIGVVSLNLPLIYQRAKVDGTPFLSLVKKYTNMVLDIHDRTYEYIGKQKAGSNPLMFCEGGLYGGHLKPEDTIGQVVKKYFTSSVGITALNELTRLHNGKSILEDKTIANETVDFIQSIIDGRKEDTNLNYSLYGSPAESLCMTQVQQFRKMFGIIENVSDRDYFSNSFHCHVSEEIDGFTKQDNEYELHNKHTGGHIQYVRIDNINNKEAIKEIIKRGVQELGLYQGVNLNACTCNSCGHQWNGIHLEDCPKCSSSEITEFNRITGYLGFTRKHGDSTINEGKMREMEDRKSM